MASTFPVQDLSTLPQAYISLRLSILTTDLTALLKKEKEDEEGYEIWKEYYDFASQAYFNFKRLEAIKTLDEIERKSDELLLLLKEARSRLFDKRDLELLNSVDEVKKWAKENDVPDIEELDGLDELMQGLKL